MIFIPAGEFLMGKEPKTEYLRAYCIAKTPITNVRYRDFVQAGGKRPGHWENGEIPAGKEHHPVAWVSWDDAMDYCRWLSEVTKKTYRLPTEKEWEKAARGTKGLKYPWGNKWQNGLCNTSEAGIGDTTSVDRYSPQGDSPYGCVDMAGNVWEWTSSWYGSEKRYRVVRGGSWDDPQDAARCSCRGRVYPDLGDFNSGIRCVTPISVL
jgi:serine/threonine-protein kinase